MLMTAVQLNGAEDYDSHISIDTSTVNKDASIAREFINIFHTQHVNIE